jgi:uncharacterized RDD family membrane protein YckC
MEIGDEGGAHGCILAAGADRRPFYRVAMASEREPPRSRAPLPRLLGAGARGVRAVAGATGLDEAAERSAEEAIVAVVESPAFERALVRALESDATTEALNRALASPAVEDALIRVLDSSLVDHVWDHLLASDEVQRLVERIAEAPEVRAAIAQQGVGLLDDLGRQVRRIAGRFDAALERVVRGLLRRPQRSEPTRNVGLVTRGLAFALDGALLNGVFLAVAGVLTALFGGNGVSGTGFVFGVGAWIVAGSAYLLVFWSLAGQTPGMRALSIRIETDGDRRLGLRRARRRLGGLVLAVVPAGLGLFGIVTRDDRRGWHDRRAGTEVVRVDPPAAPYSDRPALLSE